MDYNKYEIKDFVSDEFFLQWVITGSPEATDFWEEYVANNPSQRADIDAARKFVITLRKSEHTLHTPGKARHIWKNIEDGISGHTVRRPERSFSVLKIAACITLLAAAVLPWYVLELPQSLRALMENERVAAEEGFLETVNNTGDVLPIHLSDGSVVHLHHNSRLRYRDDYSDQSTRTAFLSGEAFFDIAKNPKQPFLVYSAEVVTKVLGTSFRIRAFEDDEDFVIAVKEGKVSVYSGREISPSDSLVFEVNGVVLTPNQQVVYVRAEDLFVKTLIETPQVIQGHEVASLFLFENTPAMEVFRVLETAYGVDIIVDEEVMRNCYLTVRLSNESLFHQLTIICRTLGAQYELIDAKVIISGKGC